MINLEILNYEHYYQKGIIKGKHEAYKEIAEISLENARKSLEKGDLDGTDMWLDISGHCREKINYLTQDLENLMKEMQKQMEES